MKSLVILLAALFLASPVLPASDNVTEIRPAGTWIQNDVKWKNAPESGNPHLQVADVKLLLFNADHTFAVVECVLNRVPHKYIAISHGDGEIVYLGTWQSVANHIVANYRLVSRTVALEGERLPGEEQREVVTGSRSLLRFGGRSYKRTRALEKSTTEIADIARKRELKEENRN